MPSRLSVPIALTLVCSTAAFATESMTGKKERGMVNCPSAVAGAKTSVFDRKDGVEVRVSALAPAARAEIHRRAEVQARLGLQTERGALEHTGTGTGSGKYGFCPGIMEDTRVEVDETADGARLIVRAKDPTAVKRLQKLTHQRANAL
jgi:hypothetical protein